MNESLKKRLIACSMWTVIYTLIKIPVDYFIDGYVKFSSVLLTAGISALLMFFFGYPIYGRFISHKKSDE